MPKIDINAVPGDKGSSYPAPFHLKAADRMRQALGEAGGLTDFGVNLLHLPPGAWSSQRHWHSAEDEFAYVLAGEVVLIDDDGETLLRAGDCATFAKNQPNGHHLVNKANAVAIVLEVGTRSPQDDECIYPDIDMRVSEHTGYTHRDGTPYPERKDG